MKENGHRGLSINVAGTISPERITEKEIRRYLYNSVSLSPHSKNYVSIQKEKEIVDRLYRSSLKVKKATKEQARNVMSQTNRGKPNDFTADAMIITNYNLNTEKVAASKMAKNIQALKLYEREKKDEAHFTKVLEAYRDFMLKMSLSFNIVIKFSEGRSYPAYKYSIGKGNNATLIKALMKQRWWWVQTDSKDLNEINFMWTQTRQNKFVEMLKPKKKTGADSSELGTSFAAISVDTAEHTDLTSNMSESDNEADQRGVSAISSQKKRRRFENQKLQVKTQDTTRTEEDAQKPKEIKSALSPRMSKLFTSVEVAFIQSYSPNKQAGGDDNEEQVDSLKEKTPVNIITEPNRLKMCNHIENNFHLGNKKALLWNMRHY